MFNTGQFTVAVLILIALSSCAAPAPVVKQEYLSPYTVKGKTYRPLKKVNPGFTQDGIASWYGPGFHGKKTASGEVYNMHELSAAHNILPLKTRVKVTNLQNGKELVVRVNDRGPFVNDRMIDLSLAAAQGLGIVRPGTAPVRLTVLGPGDRAPVFRPPGTGGPQPFPKTPNPFFTNAPRGLLALVR
jgi:rare lipoprotein A (peptidoglycan hydrolase)